MYWSVDAPGLDEAGAVALVGYASEFASVVGASAVNPSHWLTQHLDADTVMMLVRALDGALVSGALSPEDAWGVTQMLEDYRGWLDASGQEN
jgi:DNA-binding transcriptional regulator YdaS (Cro superfamily)